MNKPYQISPHEYSLSFIINLAVNKKGEGRGGGLKERRGLTTFFLWKVEAY